MYIFVLSSVLVVRGRYYGEQHIPVLSDTMGRSRVFGYSCPKEVIPISSATDGYQGNVVLTCVCEVFRHAYANSNVIFWGYTDTSIHCPTTNAQGSGLGFLWEIVQMVNPVIFSFVFITRSDWTLNWSTLIFYFVFNTVPVGLFFYHMFVRL